MTGDIRTREMLLAPTEAILMLALDIREGRALVDVRSRCVLQLKRFKEQKQADKDPPDSINDRMFALAALLDETWLGGACDDRSAWIAKTLQQEFFGTNEAGNEFFFRLDRLCAEPSSGTDLRLHIEILEIYLECLCAGFAGKYRMEGEDARLVRIRNTARIIASFSDRIPADMVSKPTEIIKPIIPLSIKVVLIAVFWCLLVWLVSWFAVRLAWEPIFKLIA